jgi:hypothetical protein
MDWIWDPSQQEKDAQKEYLVHSVDWVGGYPVCLANFGTGKGSEIVMSVPFSILSSR